MHITSHKLKAKWLIQLNKTNTLYQKSSTKKKKKSGEN